MRPRTDSALSDTTATILIIILVAILATVVVVLISGVTLLPEKPVLAAFTVDTVMGAHRGTGAPDVPVIRLYQMAGAPLIQEYEEHTHSAINGTKIKLIDPDGNLFTAVTADSMTGKTIEKGEPLYIFHYHTTASETPWIWLTNDPSRVFGSSGVEPFHPSGTWRLLITEEIDTNMVTFQKDIIL